MDQESRYLFLFHQFHFLKALWDLRRRRSVGQILLLCLIITIQMWLISNYDLQTLIGEHGNSCFIIAVFEYLAQMLRNSHHFLSRSLVKPFKQICGNKRHFIKQKEIILHYRLYKGCERQHSPIHLALARNVTINPCTVLSWTIFQHRPSTNFVTSMVFTVLSNRKPIM